MQQRLEDQKQKVKYHSEAYNKCNKTEQWIRISDGCPNQCPYCYASKKLIEYPIPKIIREKVCIMDMNLLCQKNAKETLTTLTSKQVNGKSVKYELICGVDYRFLTDDLAEILYKGYFGRFNRKREWERRIRIAWDWEYKKLPEIKATYGRLKLWGFRSEEIMIFIISNWKIPMEECIKKLDVIKIWGCLAADCWYDNQIRGNVIPIYWTSKEIDYFGKKCRKHNQLINYNGYDPEI